MLICLDFDGVLVDSFDELMSMMVDVQAELGRGRVPVADDFRSIEHLTFEAVARRIGLEGDDVSRFGRGMLARQSVASLPRLFPGVVDALATLARCHVLVVVTANHARIVRAMLPPAGIDALIRAVYGSEKGESKAQRIAAACRRHGFAPGDAVMVGDAVSDIRAGREAGVACAAVTWGYQPRERLLTAAPDAWLDSPADLASLPDTLARVATGALAGASAATRPA